MKLNRKIITPYCIRITKVYNSIKSGIKDLLTIDKTTVNTFCKEVKTELQSKEGKKRLLSILLIVMLVLFTTGITVAVFVPTCDITSEPINITVLEDSNLDDSWVLDANMSSYGEAIDTNFTCNDTDGDALYYTITSPNIGFLGNGSYGTYGLLTNDILNYTLINNLSGLEQDVVINVSDGIDGDVFISANVTITEVNDAPWWNETLNNTYSYSEDSGEGFIIWDEAGLNNTYWDVEENHLPYNCTVSANDTNIVTNVSYDDGSDGAVRANSIANVSGAFILTVNCSDSSWLSELTSFDIVINAVNDAPWWEFNETMNSTWTNNQAVAEDSTTYITNMSDYFRDVEETAPSYMAVIPNETSVSCTIDTGFVGNLSCTTFNNFTSWFEVNVTAYDDLVSNSIFTNFLINVSNTNDNPWNNGTFDNVTQNEDFDDSIPGIDAITNADLNANWSDVEDTAPTTYEYITSTNSSTSCYFDASNNWECISLANQSGTDYYTFSLNESDGTGVIYDWQITVNAQNDAPWWEFNETMNSTWTNNQAIAEDSTTYITNMSDYFRDVEETAPSYMAVIPNETSVSCTIDTGFVGNLSCTAFNNFTSWFEVNVTAYDDLVSNSITENFEINVSNVNDNPWWDPDLVQNQTTTEDSESNITYNLDEFSWDVEADINLINMTYGIDTVFGDNNASGTNCSINGAELYCVNEAENRTGDNILNITALDSNGAMTSIFMNISTLPVNDNPWWNETSNTTYLYNEDFGTDFTIWDEDGLNNTYWDVEDGNVPKNCTAEVNDTNIATNIRWNGSIIADSVANNSGVFILTTNCSDDGWLSDVTNFEITVDPGNDEPTAPLVTLNFTYDNTNYTNESMWCQVYIEDIDNTTGLSVDLIVMNSTSSDIDTAVEQYFLPDAYVSQNNGTYVSFEINETNFTKNSYVWCQAKINDQEFNSSWTNSTSLKVENYPVQISDPLGNFSLNEDFDQDYGGNFTIYWGNNWTDADNNTYESDETYINWTFFMNDTEILGVTMNNDTDTVSIGSLPNTTGTVEINWTVIDSDNATYNETVYWTVNAVNDNPWWDLIGNTTANILEADGGGNQTLGKDGDLNVSTYFRDVENDQSPDNVTVNTNVTDVECFIEANFSIFCAPSNGFIGDFIITLNGTDNGNSQVHESFEAYVNDSTPPSFVPLSNDPSDIDSLSLFGRLLNISYNISDLKGVNPNSVLIYYKTNSSTNNNLYFVNGSYLTDDYITNEIKISTTNESDIWNFTLDGENSVYPWTVNINETLMEETSPEEYKLTSDRNYIKIEFYNVSNDKNFSVFEIMAENLTEDSNVLIIFYCNSSYTTGNPSSDEDCAKLSDWEAEEPFNHTHSDYSKHHLIPFPINTTTGETAGNIYVTNTSYFLLRGTKSAIDNWNVSYISGEARDGATQTSNNAGNNWADLDGTANAHLHQYNGDETFYYFVSACDAFNNCANSSEGSDPISLAGLPPSAPTINAPTDGYYGDWLGLANMTIDYTEAISPNGYPISFYNISLVNTDETFNLTINPNNTLDLSYSWNLSEAISGEYYIRVEACDNQDQCSFGYSDNITLDNTAPVVTLVSPDDGNNSNGTGFTTEFEFNCSITDNIGIANITLYGNWTGEWHANQTMDLIDQVIDNSTTFLVKFIRGSYDWNCLAADQAGNEMFASANRTFTILNNRPTDVLVDTPLNETNYSVMPVFAWSNSTDLENDLIEYLLEIDDDPKFTQYLNYSNVSIAETANTTKDVSVSDSLTTEGKYFWRVLSTDLYDNATAWSEVRYFTFDSTKPSITVNYPGNGSVLYTKDDGTPGRTLLINFTVTDNLANTIDSAWWVNSSGDANSTEFAFIEDIDIDTRHYSINITDWGPDGDINLSIWANDSASNEVALHYVYTILTESKPQVEWISDVGPTMVSGNFDILVNITANATAGDNFAGINYTWLEVNYQDGTIVNLTMDNSSVTEYYMNFTPDNFSDGWYYMRAYANYTATGQEGTAGELIREIDNTPPNITIDGITVGSESFDNNSWSKYGNLEFHYAVSDNWTGRDEYGLNNHTIVNCSLVYLDSIAEGQGAYNQTNDTIIRDVDQNFTLSGIDNLTDGNYNWTINCTDEVLNTGTDNQIKLINVDISFPQLEFNTPSENELMSNVSNHPQINLTITDIISGVNHTWLEINNSDSSDGIMDVNNESLTESLINNEVGTNATYAYDWNTLLYADDWYTITVYANDSANNENLTVRTVKVDNSGPNITLESPAPNKVMGDGNLTFQAIVSDFSTITNCSLIINDKVNYTITSNIVNDTLVGLPTTLIDDVYEWTVNCTDEVNNEGTNESVYTVTIDTSNPIIFLDVGPSVLEFYLDNCSINWSIIELDLHDNYTYTKLPDNTILDNNYIRNFENFTLSAQENLTILGNYRVTTYAEDGRGAAGSTTNSTTFEVRDTIAPDVIIVSPENGTIQNSSDITFSFNTSDYHSVSNCTLWFNETANYTNVTVDNNITVTQNLNIINVADEENVPWNISCYDNSTNSNNFSNLSNAQLYNAGTAIHLIMDIDTTPPLIDFIDITELNNTYFSRNSTYINVSVTELHNDTVTIVWNYTTNCTPGFSTPGFNEVLATPGEGNVIFYEINITDLTDGVYEYYVFANDTLANESEGHDNISEVRTITIDETPPPVFDLLEPANNIETTDDTPTFNWEDSTDINLENYTLEIDNDQGFNPIFQLIDINTTDSYYALSTILDPGTWYWRVRATDKANNQRTSTSTFRFTIGSVSLPTQYIQGPGGGGGGGGGKKIVYGVVDILQPGMQTLYEKETITTPIIIQNTGEGSIRGITLEATVNSPSIKLKLSKTYIENLAPGQQEKAELKITAEGVVGEYEVTVKAEAIDPKVTDQVKFYVNLVGFGLGKRTIMEEKLRFIGKLFESNPECLELREMVEEAKKKLEEKDYDKSLEIIESAIKSCEELVKASKKKVLEKPAEPKKTLQILIGEIILFILMFIMIYRYYRTRKYKGPVIMKKGKPGPTLILLIFIFLGGFFILKEYTGFTVFEDIPGSDSFGGDRSGTTLDSIGATVNLSLPTTLGNFTSRVFTANFTVEWQTINWSWSSTAEDNVTMDVRTSIDNITWSSWSENVTNTSKIPDAKNIWTDKEDFIGDLDNVSITDLPGNITLYTGNETGTFTSESLDLGFTGVNIATIEFTITNTSEEDNVTIETSTSADNSTWEAWAQTSVSGDQVLSTDNRYFKWRATLVTNDTTITPVLEDLTVNYERNSTYLQYRATLSTNNPALTPALEWVNITYQDANLPLFGFLDPTPENGSSITDDFTYINFTITEPNNDSFYLNWNGTQYNPVDMNETETVSEGMNVYALNLTGLSESTTPSNFSLLNPPDNHRSTSAKPFFLWEDSINNGTYEYYIWANDTYGHENQTENRTVTLSYNIDNYTLEISTSPDSWNTTTLIGSYYSTSPNYQLNDSEALPDNGTYYWRVIAYNKAGNNYITDYFTYHVGIAAPVAYAPGTMGEGGGGGKPVERRQSGIELIKPSALSFFANRQVIIPLLVVNTGTQILQGIELTAESADLELELKNNYFPILRPHQEIDPQLVVKPIEDPGRYSIVVKAKVADPEFTDAIMFMIDVTEFGFGNKTETEEKLTFVVDFIKSNDECAELEKAINDAKEAFKKNEFDLALSLAEQAVQNCKDLVSTAKEKKLEKKKRPAWQYYVPLLEVLLFLLIFSVVYSYYKRMKFKRRRYW